MAQEPGIAAVERARQLIGVRFRPQGRSPALGLDCLGLAALAFRLPTGRVPVDYRLHASARERLERELGAYFRQVPPAEITAGDLAVVEPGVGQLHVLILTGRGYIHADAGLRRIVEAPGPSQWPLLSTWRCSWRH